MATKLMKPPIQTPHVVPQNPKIIITTKMRITTTHSRQIPTIHPWTKFTRFANYPSGSRPISTIKAAEQTSDTKASSLTHLKTELYSAIHGINRGIFGVQSEKKSQIEDLVKQLEAQNPIPDPTLNLNELGGLWKLIYSTVTILGSKRTKLGLRDFITLDDFFQTIDVSQGKAVNTIKFSARGLSLLNGQLQIVASFKISSKSRVDISYENSTITPDQLMNMFKKNYEILLGIFNPEGWLEITYVDDTMRIGRDDKGNTFILERCQEK